MTSIVLTPHVGSHRSVPVLTAGWHRLDTDIGCEFCPRLDAVQLRAARGGWYSIRIGFASGRVWQAEGYLPPRGILTVRPDSPAPTLGLLRPGGKDYEYSGGGGNGIDACGTPGSVHDHDAEMQRCPIGLYDMATGRLRAASSVAVDSYYEITRGWNKVTTLPEYVVKQNPANQWDDSRAPSDATAIPASGSILRASVLSFAPYDGQHLIRAYRFALLHQNDPIVQADLRALLRDAEVAWSAAREAKILARPGGRGDYEIGREFAWVAYLAAVVEKHDNRLSRAMRDLFGVGFAARMRRIARHVAHSQTGILQRFVEGMSGSPYPYGPRPNSGVPEGRGIALTQHLEACAQIVALEALGMREHAAKLAKTILTYPGLKWWNTDTGHPEGGDWHGPAEDQAWPAIAAWLRIDRAAALPCVMRHKVPGANGAWPDPYNTIAETLAALRASPEKGKVAWAIEELEP